MFRRWRGLIWSDIWNIHVNGGDDFQMIIFDLINSILNFWSRLEFWYFNSAVHTKRIINFAKGCSDFRNIELWWNIDWYFIDHFSRFWYARFFWNESNQFFSNMFQFLMLFLHKIHKHLFRFFKIFIRWRKHGQKFSLKVILRGQILRSDSKHFECIIIKKSQFNTLFFL